MSTFPVNGYASTTAIQPGYPEPVVVNVPAQNQGGLPDLKLPNLDLKDTWAKSGLDAMSAARLGGAGAAAYQTVARAGSRIGTSAVRSGAKAAIKSGARATAKRVATKGVRVGTAGAASGGLARAIGGSALIAIPMALITNFLDFKRGKITADQRNTLMIADSVGYTAAGAGGTMLGAAIGSALMPGLGTVVGIGASIGLGYLYEKFLRPKFPAPAAQYEQPK